MKKILASLMTIALMGILIGGGVYAYFSDTEASTGNQFAAGTLDLTVDDENPWTSTKLTVNNMKPGDSGAVDCTLENVGNLAFLDFGWWNLPAYFGLTFKEIHAMTSDLDYIEYIQNTNPT